MAVNPETGVDYEVDRFAIFRVSTGQYTNLNAQWPRVDGGPIVGGNPDYKYYKKAATPAPDIDHRYTLTSVWDKVDASPTPPEGHPAGVYGVQYIPEKLPLSDLIIQIETEFQRQVGIAIPATSLPSELAAQIDAIVRKQDGAVLTPKQQAKKDNAKTVGDKLTTLEARRDELIASATAGEDYDLTNGWTV